MKPSVCDGIEQAAADLLACVAVRSPGDGAHLLELLQTRRDAMSPQLSHTLQDELKGQARHAGGVGLLSGGVTPDGVADVQEIV